MNENHQAYTTGHCKELTKPGGCQLHNLQCAYPSCDRKPVEKQNEPVVVLRGIDEFGPILHWNKHWTDFPIGTKFYVQHD